MILIHVLNDPQFLGSREWILPDELLRFDPVNLSEATNVSDANEIQPKELEIALNLIPGVVETGLFVNRTNILIVGTPQGVQTQHIQRT